MEVPCSQEELDELLVFGYASNIYRDDERSQWIEDGRHLIPLLGDSSILIDRYDGRGALVDPNACEPLTTGTLIADTDPDELEMERLCDLERYRDCQDDEELGVSELRNGRGTTIKDEVIEDRSSRTYAMFEYSYDSPEPEEKESEDFRMSARDYVYAPPAGLYLPPDLILPQTMKSHAVIEKTAKFIASHGTQMEIILKTKQGTNSLFNFLTFNDELHPYYKYLVAALKTNAYKPPERASQDERTPHASDSEDEDHYLHPSLVTKPASTTSETKASRISEYKATGPSAYSALVSKIQEMEQPLTEEAEEVVQSIRQLGTKQDANLGAELPSSRTRVPPSGETQVIIEKMAHYVVKNGPAFESLASTKGDTRFKFLNPADPHHWYYIFCKQNFEANQVGAVISGGFVPYTKDSDSEESTTGAGASEPSLNHSPENNLAQRPSSVPPKPPPPDHANAINRMATLPPALIDKIEQLRKRTLENRVKVLSAAETVTPPFPAPALGIPRVEGPLILAPLQPPCGKSMEEPHDQNGQNRDLDKDDEEIRRKAERRKRAALFLEKMKAKTETPAPVPSPPIAESNEVEIIAEIHKAKSPAAASPGSESDVDDEVEEIARISPRSRTEKLKRVQSDSDSEEEPHRKRHSKSKKRSKYSSDSHDSGSEDERHRSHSSSHKKKSSKKKKHKKGERSKGHSSSEKSKTRR